MAGVIAPLVAGWQHHDTSRLSVEADTCPTGLTPTTLAAAGKGPAWKRMPGRQADGLLQEGELRVVEAEDLVHHVGLGLHCQAEHGQGLAATRTEQDLQDSSSPSVRTAHSYGGFSPPVLSTLVGKILLPKTSGDKGGVARAPWASTEKDALASGLVHSMGGGAGSSLQEAKAKFHARALGWAWRRWVWASPS